MTARKKLVLAIAGATCLGLLTACGGGGGGSDDAPASTGSTQTGGNTTGGNTTGGNTTQNNSVSGTAAVGAPLVGSVTVKDATGATKTVQIGSNGSYTVDVTGMTAPFIFRAEGRANGRSYTVHSAATAADANGTINITQLTDLVVSNIAGQLAANYFESGNFSSLSKTELDAEAAKLKEKLLPVLTALGVDASVDLMRTQFTPLASALDTALDVLRVSVDTQTNVATITNVVTQQAIQDDLNTKAAAETAPATLTDTSNLSGALTDAELIKTALNNFAQLFATHLPTQQTIENALPADFLLFDMDRATTASDFASENMLLGMTFSDLEILRFDYSVAQPTATVAVTWKAGNGAEILRVKPMLLRKGNDGVWRLLGDLRVLDLEVHPHVVKNNNCVMTGVEFLIDNDNTGNDGGAINHLRIFGPGLPGNGLKYVSNTGSWVIEGRTTPYYIFANSCADSRALTDAQIAAIPDDARYLVVAYSSVDDSARLNFPRGAIANAENAFANGGYALSVEKRSPTLAEAQSQNLFPLITAPQNAANLANYNGGPLTVTAEKLNLRSPADVILEYSTQSGGFEQTDAWEPVPASGIVTVNLTLTPAGGDPITHRSLRVGSNDDYRRTWMTEYSTTAN